MAALISVVGIALIAVFTTAIISAIVSLIQDIITYKKLEKEEKKDESM